MARLVPLGVALGVLSLLACAADSGGDEGGPPASVGGKADYGAPTSDFATDGRTVVRGSLEFSETGFAQALDEPFDHRGGRWSAFPFVGYPGSELALRVQVHDEQMVGRTGAWLFGPQRDDGGWDEPVAMEFDGATGELTAPVEQYAGYVMLVGPTEELPRYPAPRARFRARDSADEIIMNLVPDGEGRTALQPSRPPPASARSAEAFAAAATATGDSSFEILEPSPESFAVPSAGPESAFAAASSTRSSAAPVFRARGASGEIAEYELVEWLQDMELIPATPDEATLELAASPADDSASVPLRVPRALGHFEAMAAPADLPVSGVPTRTLRMTDEAGELRSYLVVESFGADGAPGVSEPAILMLVPDQIDGRPVAVIATPGCDDASCPRLAVYARDDGDYEEEDLVEDPFIRSYRVAPSQGQEPSTFSIFLRCHGSCGVTETPPPPSDFAESSLSAFRAATAAGRHVPTPKYPVYFAHGFNADDSSWDAVEGILSGGNAHWRSRMGSGTVPKHEDVRARAEQLQRNLSRFVARFEPEPGDDFVRVNVVAHSMGGLDARFLMGHPDYNERCLERGTCEPDDDGQPVYWRDRIASLTTLSSPHCGSRFSSWGLDQLDKRFMNWGFKKVANRFFGMGDADQAAFRRALGALALEYHQFVEACEARDLPVGSRHVDPEMPDFAPPMAGRQFNWQCATRGTCPRAPRAVDGPRRSGRGLLLPAPGDHATIFSWGGVTCVNGSCGDVVEPALLLPYNIEREAGANDGVVSIESARFGIYMGARPGDHFNWTSENGRTSGAISWLFGVKKEPLAAFYAYWFDLLARSGY